MFTVSIYEEFQDVAPKLYLGDNIMTEYYKHLLNKKEWISKILQLNEPTKPSTAAQKKIHDEATSSVTCLEQFTLSNHKTHHHSHVTDFYVGPLVIIAICG
jgi:hypothetical protein